MRRILASTLIAIATVVVLQTFRYRIARDAIESQGQHAQQVFDDLQKQAKDRQAAAKAARDAELMQKRRETEAAAAQARAEAEEKAAREAAWEKYYKPRSECLHADDWDKQVVCGNEFMKARRTFDASYQPTSNQVPIR